MTIISFKKLIRMTCHMICHQQLALTFHLTCATRQIMWVTWLPYQTTLVIWITCHITYHLLYDMTCLTHQNVWSYNMAATSNSFSDMDDMSYDTSSNVWPLSRHLVWVTWLLHQRTLMTWMACHQIVWHVLQVSLLGWHGCHIKHL